jgi:hypothetical protein
MDKITVEVLRYENRDYDTYESLKINGKVSVGVSPLYECPEDAIIGRDLVSCSDIQRYMEMAYKWGKDGTEVEFTYRDTEDRDDM